MIEALIFICGFLLGLNFRRRRQPIEDAERAVDELKKDLW